MARSGKEAGGWLDQVAGFPSFAPPKTRRASNSPFCPVFGQNHPFDPQIGFFYTDINVDAFRINVDAFRINVVAFRINVDVFRINVDVFRINVDGFRINVDVFRINVDGFRINADGSNRL